MLYILYYVLYIIQCFCFSASGSKPVSCRHKMETRRDRGDRACQMVNGCTSYSGVIVADRPQERNNIQSVIRTTHLVESKPKREKRSPTQVALNMTRQEDKSKQTAVKHEPLQDELCITDPCQINHRCSRHAETQVDEHPYLTRSKHRLHSDAEVPTTSQYEDNRVNVGSSRLAGKNGLAGGCGQIFSPDSPGVCRNMC